MIFAHSDRLILRRPRAEDFKAMLPCWSDPEMTRYTDACADPPSFLERLIADMNAKQPGETEPGGPWYNYVIERSEDGAVIGDLGAGFGVPGERQVELGYRIHPAFHRHGYAREAVTALINNLIDAHDVRRFVGTAAADNAASIAVLRSLSFRQEGRFRQSFFCRGEWIDEVCLALLAGEWLQGK